MSKILGIGLPRTGTASLSDVFVMLGYRTRHYPKYVDRVRAYEALIDVPMCNEFEVLDKMYPGSKFILSVRDLDSWLVSCKFSSNRFRWHDLRPEGRCGPEVFKAHMEIFNTTAYDEDKFIEGYHRHYSRVIDYFKDRDDLLVYNLKDEDKLTRVCTFLGKETPDDGFPHKNKSKK
jgi:hypothetical protein